LWATVVLHVVLFGTMWLVRPDPGLSELKPRAVETVNFTPVEIIPPPIPPEPEPETLIRPEPVPFTRTPPPPPVLDMEAGAATQAIPVPGPVVRDPQAPIVTTAVVPIQVTSSAPVSADLREGIDYQCRKLNYPISAERRNLQGTVGLLLRINRSGTLVAAEVARSSGHRVLDNAAMRWVRGCSFTPPALDGGSVEAVARMPVQFILR
jgi:periplasmic protein TonB